MRLIEQPAVLEWFPTEMKTVRRYQPIQITRRRRTFETVASAVSFGLRLSAGGHRPHPTRDRLFVRQPPLTVVVLIPQQKPEAGTGNEAIVIRRHAGAGNHGCPGTEYGLKSEQPSCAGLHVYRSRWCRGLPGKPATQQQQRHRQRGFTYPHRRHQKTALRVIILVATCARR